MVRTRLGVVRRCGPFADRSCSFPFETGWAGLKPAIELHCLTRRMAYLQPAEQVVPASHPQK